MAASFVTEPVKNELSRPCPCCGRSIHEGSGWLLAGNEERACYSYRWSEGHDVRFILAIAGVTAGEMRQGFAIVSCAKIGEALQYSAINPEGSPWEASDAIGRPLTREEVLAPEGPYPDLWQLTDAIVQHEPRLAERILTSCGV